MPGASHPIGAPSKWVERFAALIPSGQVLDLACGSGRHTRLLASLGLDVVAVDRDASSLEALKSIASTLQADLEHPEFRWPFEDGCFAGVVVTNYLHRPLFPMLMQSLAPGGVLIYETFCEGNEAFGKPSNPEFLLRENELLERVSSAPAASHHLRVVAFEQGHVTVPHPAVIQRLCAIKRLADSGATVLPVEP